MTDISRKENLSNRENRLQESGILNYFTARPRYITSTRSIEYSILQKLLETSGRIRLNLAYKNREIQKIFKDFFYVLEGYSEVLL